MKKKNIITSITMIILAVIYTILVKIIDVAPIGPNNSEVGFSKINGFFHNLLGSNMTIYKITEILGIIPLLMAGIYAIIGVVELIKRKSFTKVDREIYALAGLYVVVLGLYIFFEKCIINYRPILIDGVLEASYPSSHTLMALCICGSSIIVNKRIFHKKIFYPHPERMKRKIKITAPDNPTFRIQGTEMFCRIQPGHTWQCKKHHCRYCFSCPPKKLFLILIDFNRWKNFLFCTVIPDIFRTVLSFLFLISQYGNTIHDIPPLPFDVLPFVILIIKKS